MSIEIYEINTGYIKMKSGFYLFPGLKDKTVYPVLVFLIKINKKMILFDTGLSDKLKGNIGIFERFLTFIDIEECSLLKQMERLKLKPDNVDIVINSHLHFDHCSGNHNFKEKPILVQKKEIISYNESRKNPMYLPMIDNQNFITIEGSYDILKDNTVHLIPAFGHSEGQQILTIENDKYFILFLADSCYIKDGKFLPIEVDSMKNYKMSTDTIGFINNLIERKNNKKTQIFSTHDFSFEEKIMKYQNHEQIIKYFYS